jgi:hypothetical protein
VRHVVNPIDAGKEEINESRKRQMNADTMRFPEKIQSLPNPHLIP